MAQTNNTDVSCLDDLLYYSSIDDATKIWLASLHHTWGIWKRSDRVTEILDDYFNTAPNPHLSTLRILVNIPDFKHLKSKTSLCFTVVEELSRWMSTRRDSYAMYLTPDLKVAAFRLLVKQKNLQLTKMVSHVYEFVQHKDIFLPLIQNMLLQKKYKDATQYATMLRLQSHFLNPELMLIPLILQNKLTVVDDFLMGCTEAQTTLILYLDNLLGPGQHSEILLDSFASHHDIPEVKVSMMQVRAINKLVGRLAKSFKLPPEVCPNLNQRREEGALKFLVYKRYVDGSLGGESWNEMARETVGTDAKLQLKLVNCISQANDPREALRWAKEYEIPEDQWPWSIIGYDEATPEDTPDTERNDDHVEENWDVEVDAIQYHCFGLPRNSIKIVDTVRLFDEFLTNGLEDVDIVGIDSEWKPSFGTKQSDLALIQIATKSNVYILDVMSMGKKDEDLWAKLGSTLFNNKNILKLGFGLAHDIATIRESLPALYNIKATGQGYIDMLHLWRKLSKEHNFQFPHQGDPTFTKESLSKLVELCMGARLNKSDQFSNWERRPLRDSQLTYAALDAYCLLEIFEVLRSQSERLDILFHEICLEIQHVRVAQKLPKKHSKKTSPKVSKESKLTNESHCNLEKGVPDSSCSQQLAHGWRVVCDSMLGGLARQLRMCGCDCIYVKYDRRGDKSAKLATRQNRVLLTRGGAYNRFAQYVPSGNCYRVLADKPDDQLKEVLGHFKVLVMQRDIFSRCQICNCDEFVQASRDVLTKLRASFVEKTRRDGGNRRFLSTRFDDNSDQKNALNSGVTREECCLNNDINPLEWNKRNRTWRLQGEVSIDIANCTTRYGVTIQIDQVPVNVMKNVNGFYICECCGKVYWDGSHMERALNGVLKDIISQQ